VTILRAQVHAVIDKRLLEYKLSSLESFWLLEMEQLSTTRVNKRQEEKARNKMIKGIGHCLAFALLDMTW